MDMNVIFESENIIYVRPSFDLVPQYLEMVNDIENVAKFIGERRTLLTEQEEIDYIKDKMDNNATMFSMLEKGTNEFIGNIGAASCTCLECSYPVLKTFFFCLSVEDNGIES